MDTRLEERMGTGINLCLQGENVLEVLKSGEWHRELESEGNTGSLSWQGSFYPELLHVPLCQRFLHSWRSLWDSTGTAEDDHNLVSSSSIIIHHNHTNNENN